jgi:hypothetical protein
MQKKTKICIFIILLLFFPLEKITALPSKRKVNSVKSLTYVLSKVEKKSGKRAIFVTLKLQIYLEDVYISQGTPVILHPRRLSIFIKQMVNREKSKKEIAKEILRLYKQGKFHDR